MSGINNAFPVRSFLLFLILAGCAPKHADLAAYPLSPEKVSSTALIRSIEYDDKGRPIFENRLKERPARAGGQFTLVQFTDGKPARSFDIVVEPEQADLTRPLKVVYEWTGKGFQAGVAAGKSYADSAIQDKQKTKGEPVTLTSAEAAVTAGSVITLTVGGFIVGVAASIPATIEELSHVAVNAREKVISFSTYEYDEEKRLSRMKTYLPSDVSHEIIKTDFFYQGDEKAPFKTEITSYPENTVRTIP